MSSSNVAWLCNYINMSLVKVHGIDITFPNIKDAVKFHKLSKQKELNEITESEILERSLILAKSVEQNDSWGQAIYLSNDNMPSKIYKKPNRELPQKEEKMFCVINGYLIFNQTCYEVIKGFNLGQTHFSEVHIYDIETEELLDDTPYYFINIAERREFLDVEHSQGLREIANNNRLPRKSLLSAKDNDIKLIKKALEVDVDLWHDPILRDSLFLSDRLVHALFDAGIQQDDLALLRCEII